MSPLQGLGCVITLFPGRCPGLSYFAPLGLIGGVNFSQVEMPAEMRASLVSDPAIQKGIGGHQRCDQGLHAAAAGSVGHMVGQIATIKGAHAVGVASSDAKLDVLTNKLGFASARCSCT